MKIVVIDGQGGSLGRAIVDCLKKYLPEYPITAIGTNSIATSSMLKAGAEQGATGENPVILACSNADIIIGPMGIIAANSLLGEITPTMALAIGQSKAKKILLPVNKCNIIVTGIQEMTYNEHILLAVDEARRYIKTGERSK